MYSQSCIIHFNALHRGNGPLICVRQFSACTAVCLQTFACTASCALALSFSNINYFSGHAIEEPQDIFKEIIHAVGSQCNMQSTTC